MTMPPRGCIFEDITQTTGAPSHVRLRRISAGLDLATRPTYAGKHRVVILPSCAERYLSSAFVYGL